MIAWELSCFACPEVLVGRLLRDPQGDVAAIAQDPVVFTPVFDAISRFVFCMPVSFMGLGDTLHHGLWVDRRLEGARSPHSLLCAKFS